MTACKISKVVLALDTASKTGWAVFHGARRYASGVVVLRQRTISKTRQPRGAKYSQLLDLLNESVRGEGPIDLMCVPDVVVLETGGFFRSRAAAEMSHAIMGVVELWAYEHNIRTAHILNWDVKRHATGSRQASKTAMVRRARELWPRVKIADDNEADALHLGRAYVDGVKVQ